MSFLKKGILGLLSVLWALNTTHAQEKIPAHLYEAAQRFIDSISLFSVGSYEMSSGVPMRIAIQKGALDIVGDVRLNLYLGSCLSEKEEKLFFKILHEKLRKQYPNCKLYKHSHKCVHNSPAVKTTCALRMNKTLSCPPPKGISEMALEVKCILPLRSMNVFFTKEKVYK